MSPRKRRVENQAVIETAARVVTERGARRTRLADVAVEVGLAPATLLQRFGSREELLSAVARLFADRIAVAFSAPGPSPLAGLASALVSLSESGDLAVLLADFGAHGRAYSLELRKQIGFRLAAAIQAGELSQCDVAFFARRIQLGQYGLASAALLEGDVVTAASISAMLHEILAGYI